MEGHHRLLDDDSDMKRDMKCMEIDLCKYFDDDHAKHMGFIIAVIIVILALIAIIFYQRRKHLK